MDDQPIQTSADSPRQNIWRRVWIAIALFFVAAPIVLWIAIDQVGKAEWRKVQAQMKTDGVRLHFSELDLPNRADIPDAENFCAIPWLMANADGSESDEMREAAAKLTVFGQAHTGVESDYYYPALGDLEIGRPASLFLWRICFDQTALGSATSPATTKSDPKISAQAIAGYLAPLESLCQDLEAAMPRSEAHWIPFYSEQLAAGRSPWEIEMRARVVLIRDLITALGLRALIANELGDPQTAVRSLEMQCRIVRAAALEPGMDNMVLARVLAEDILLTVMHCFWSPAFINDADALRRLQGALETIDFTEFHQLASRREIARMTGGILLAAENRTSASGYLMYDNDGWQASALQVLPKGWFQSTAAQAAEIYHREILVPMPEQSPYGFERQAQEAEDLYRQYQDLKLKDYPHTFRQPAFRVVCDHGSILRDTVAIECRRRQAVIVCALYRLAFDTEGKFPKTLDQLVPGYFDIVPTDPMNTKGAGGHWLPEPMSYRRAAENFTGAPFQLWSVGVDMKDDGGHLTLNPGDPFDTEVTYAPYQGDWPWPVEPLNIDTAEPSDKE